MSLRRTAPKVVGLVAIGTALFAAAAYACTALATLNLSTNSGPVGSNVVAKGAGFSGAPGASPVVLHLDRADGPVLGQAVAQSESFTTSFTVPQTTPGQHVIVAVQKNARGEISYGSPARAAFNVAGPGAQAPSQPAAAAPPASPDSSGSSVPALAFTAVLGVVGLVLLAAGSATAMRARREGPAAARR